MNKIRETITAFASGDFLGAVHINRKECAPMPDERFNLIVKSVTRVAVSVAVAATAINVDGRKLLILAGAVLFFSWIYFGMRD